MKRNPIDQYMKDPDNKITTDGFFVSIGYVFDFD